MEEERNTQNFILGVIFVIGLICAGISVIPSNKDSVNTTEQCSVVEGSNYEKLVLEAEKEGIIKGFEEAYIGEKTNVYNCIVDEGLWNRLPFDVKQDMVKLMQGYSQARCIKVISFKAYRSGERINVALTGLRNFK